LEFLKNGEIPLDFRKILAAKVFEKTAIYDLQIAKFWAENSGEKNCDTAKIRTSPRFFCAIIFANRQIFSTRKF
jgi:AICAR transformylase/IMP cyclohydrolase PurH (only IMP cyclohydrolase domain in Aful)